MAFPMPWCDPLSALSPRLFESRTGNRLSQGIDKTMVHLANVSLAVASAAICSQLAAQDPTPPTPAAAPAAAPAPQDPQAAAKPAAARPKGIEAQVGDFKVKLGGYIKVDLIHDFDEIGSTDSFDPRTIPTDDESNPGMNTRIHARQTRLNLDVRGPTTAGDVRLYVEGDFYGEGSAFRLRHAYGVLGGLLAGQTWTTFMDEDMPETLDFESPIAFPQIRQAMVRYRENLGTGGSYWAVAVEDPASKVIEPAAPGEVEEATPDLTGRLRWENDAGHVQLGLFAGTARYDLDTEPADMVALWGANVSTKLNVVGRDHFFLQGTYGPGVGRYRGGITAAPDANGNLEPVDVLAFMVAYQHQWSDEWRSTFTYSWGEGDLPAGVPNDSTEVLEYAAANLIWQFSDRAWAGVEYLFGAREDIDDSRGEANRLQFSIRFDF